MELPDEVRQWTTKQDGIENLRLGAVAMPVPGPGEVLVRIRTVALNYRDTEVIDGLYTHHKAANGTEAIVPCSDISGEIAQLGSESQRWKVGDRVLSIFNQGHLKGQITPEDMKTGLGLPLAGTLCEYRVFPEHGLVACPLSLSDEEACTLPIAGVTAWMAMNWHRPIGSPIGSDEIVLIQGTGGVAISGLLLAKAAGARVVITSSSDSKLQRARELGADFCINYKSVEDWDREVLDVTEGKGVDVIFENGGSATLSRSFECVAFGGLISCIGYLSGKDVEVAGQLHTNVLALRRNVTLKGMLNGPAERFEELNRFVEEKGIRPVVDRVFAFEDAKDGLRYLAAGQHFGKVVVRVC